ncbi:MAG: ribosome-binding factor A [Planctomycetota bacterium]|nr:MAG: ribosome-binding factor A [Planctomycetota bacterium]
MVQPRRLARLNRLIQRRVAEILQFEAKDPRLGMVTITKVELDREIEKCKVFWTSLGDEKDRKLNEHALQHARKFVQHGVGEILPTRNVPQLEFRYDKSVVGAMRMEQLLNELRPEGGWDREEKDGDEDDAAGEASNDREEDETGAEPAGPPPPLAE